MAAKKTTISDIAIAAGVSKTTVSRYINGRLDLLSDATCKRIEKAIQLAHYRPSAVARSLKTQRSYLVGVVVANITTPFATSLLNGISAGLRDGGYTPIFADSGDSPETERALVESLVAHQIDGLIMNTTSEDNPELISLANSGMPVVLVDRFVRDYNFDIVLAPYSKPTIDLLRHAHDQGYDRIALFTQPYENNSPRETRLNAFVEVDRELFGVEEPMGDVFVVDPWRPETVDDAARRLVGSLAPGETCCVYGTNTVTLISTTNAFANLGVSTPDPIGLCGPDDWGWAHRMAWDWATLFSGGLSTFETDPEEMGRSAAELMIERIANPSGRKEQRYVPVKVRLRASTTLGREHG